MISIAAWGNSSHISQTLGSPRVAPSLNGWDRVVQRRVSLSRSRSLRTISIHYSISSFTAAAAAAIHSSSYLNRACLRAFPPSRLPAFLLLLASPRFRLTHTLEQARRERGGERARERITIHRILSRHSCRADNADSVFVRSQLLFVASCFSGLGFNGAQMRFTRVNSAQLS